MTRAQKKTLAQELYTQTDLTQIEISDIAHVTDKTIRKWAEEGNWKLLKGAHQTASPTLIKKLYLRIEEIKENDPVKYAKAVNLLTESIEKIAKRPVLSHYIQAFRELTNWLVANKELEAAQLLNKHQRNFINQKADQL